MRRSVRERPSSSFAPPKPHLVLESAAFSKPCSRSELTFWIASGGDRPHVVGTPEHAQPPRAAHLREVVAAQLEPIADLAKPPPFARNSWEQHRTAGVERVPGIGAPQPKGRWGPADLGAPFIRTGTRGSPSWPGSSLRPDTLMQTAQIQAGRLTSRRLYIELTVIEPGALEPRWDVVEAAGACGVSVGAGARDDCIDTVGSALLDFPGEARGD